MQQSKKKTKWTTVARTGDLIKLGDIILTFTKDTKSNVSITVEAPKEVKITKQELGNEQTKLS